MVIDKSRLREKMVEENSRPQMMEELLHNTEFLEQMDYHASRMFMHDWRDVRGWAWEKLKARYDALMED